MREVGLKYSAPLLSAPSVAQHNQNRHSPGGCAAPHIRDTGTSLFTTPRAPPITPVRKTSLRSKRGITSQICSVNQRRGPCFLSVQLPPQQHLPKWAKLQLSTFGSCLEQLVEGKKMCYFTVLQKFNTLIFTCHYKGRRHLIWHNFIKLYDNMLEWARITIIYYVNILKFKSRGKSFLIRIPTQQFLNHSKLWQNLSNTRIPLLVAKSQPFTVNSSTAGQFGQRDSNCCSARWKRGKRS